MATVSAKISVITLLVLKKLSEYAVAGNQLLAGARVTLDLRNTVVSEYILVFCVSKIWNTR